MHQHPAAPYPPPPPPVAPGSDTNAISAVPLEIDPAPIETPEILHERKAKSRHYMAPDMDDEKAMRAARPREIMGNRAELQNWKGSVQGTFNKRG